MPDVDDIPEECPECGGPPVETPVGYKCDDCGATLGVLDSR